MGLEIAVGVINCLVYEDDEDRRETNQGWRDRFDEANRVLSRNGLPVHAEPEDLDGTPCNWWESLGLWSRFHELRRVAASLSLGLGMPGPIEYEDPRRLEAKRRWMERLTHAGDACLQPGEPAAGSWFEHLMFHEDNEGFYLPIDFPHPLESEDAVPRRACLPLTRA